MKKIHIRRFPYKLAISQNISPNLASASSVGNTINETYGKPVAQGKYVVIEYPLPCFALKLTKSCRPVNRNFAQTNEQTDKQVPPVFHKSVPLSSQASKYLWPHWIVVGSTMSSKQQEQLNSFLDKLGVLAAACVSGSSALKNEILEDVHKLSNEFQQ